MTSRAASGSRHFSASVAPSGPCTRGPLLDITGLAFSPAMRANPHTTGEHRPDANVTITPCASAAMSARRLRSDTCLALLSSVPSRSIVISFIDI